MTVEYVVVRYTNKNGDRKSKLIAYDELADNGGNIEDFFVTKVETEIKEVGRIQVLGNTEQLDNVYVSEG